MKNHGFWHEIRRAFAAQPPEPDPSMAVTVISYRAIPRPDGSYVVLTRLHVPPPKPGEDALVTPTTETAQFEISNSEDP